MRRFLLLPLLVTAVALTPAHSFAQATGGQKAAPKASAAPKAAAEASGPKTITITAKDMPTASWDVKTIAAKPGQEIHVVLKAVGTMPKMAMSHNFVLLSKANATAKDVTDFSSEAVMAAATNYVPADKKSMVLASTPTMIGGGETTEVTFKAPTAPGMYRYLCSFPGHAGLGMTGVLTVAK